MTEWCLLARSRFGDPHIIRVPVDHTAWFLRRGWLMLIRDSDVLPARTFDAYRDAPVQRNPIRQADGDDGSEDGA